MTETSTVAWLLWLFTLAVVSGRIVYVFRNWREPFPTVADILWFLTMNTLCLTIYLTS